MTIDIRYGDCREVLRTLPDESVNCVVTSPPYFGLRDYGADGQIGLEPTPEGFVAEMVAVFREVRRVLRTDGTCWLNLGDSYSTGGHGGGGSFMKMRGTGAGAWAHREKKGWRSAPPGLKDKELVGIPWRVAFALQADGWYLRQDIIWSKPNPMPESVRDRCTKAHEYIFLLTKNNDYRIDMAAVREPVVSAKGNARSFRGGGAYTKGQTFDNGSTAKRETRGNAPNSEGKRNLRSVWTVATAPFKDAHFATFPPKLIEPCILAGCPEGGIVLDPFLGAGTTALVCQQTGRNCIGIELNADYIAIARRRLGLSDVSEIEELLS